MTQDAYEEFAERYDLFSGGFGEPDPAVVEFFRKILSDNQVRTVLDCACGTGSSLHLLHTLGFEVIGSDISDAMLHQAKKNLAEKGIEIVLKNADYRQLSHHFSQKFDAVLCLGSSILEMPDDSEALKAFQSMYAVLKDNGVLILTQGTSDRQWKEKPRFILAINNSDLSRLFVIDYLDDRNARYNILDIVRDGTVSCLKVWSRNLHVLLRDDQERLLKSAGFKSVEFFGSYKFAPYDKETSNRLITVARK